MKKTYTVPELTVVSFRTERGYAFSSLQEAAELINDQMFLLLDNNDGGNSATETFDYQSGWSDNDDDGFWTNGSSSGYF